MAKKAKKDLRHMSRVELIEIIYQYEKKVEELTADNVRLAESLRDRRVRMSKAGSIAEAALALNGVFEAADEAVKTYVASTKAAKEKERAEAGAMLAEAEKKAEEIVNRGKAQYIALKRRGEREYAQKMAQAEEDCAAVRQGRSPRPKSEDV